MHLGLIGHGAIGQALLSLLEPDPVGTLTVLVRPGRTAAASAALAGSGAARDVSVTGDPAAFVAARPDLVVEAAGQGAVAEYLPTLLGAGLTVVAASVGALADAGVAARLAAAAEAGGGRLILPAGAIGGIDLLAAVAQAGDLEVSYTGTKPPAAWRGTAAEEAVALDALTGPEAFFTGTAREAAQRFPKNANVAATLALAGAGMERTRVTLVADPAARGNRHAYTVTSPLAQFTVDIEGMPSPKNARTSLSTVYSLLREVNRQRRPVAI